MAEAARVAWWQRGAVYQVYPRSFADGNGDGVGDLPGLIEHLDHLQALDIGAVWLSPIFPSPMADFGYDVSDYCAIDPLFGTLADLDELVADCHRREIKVVLDWVLNHTSDQHPWFVASRADRADPHRDWYVWRDGPTPGSAAGGPPNNWVSRFAAVGSAWTFDEHTGQWYLHSFMREQPDLDWSNPQVRAAMYDVMRFWFDRGVDGFRLDAVHRIGKDPLLRDNEPGRRHHDDDWDTLPELLRGIRAVADSYPDRMLVGELYVLDLPRFVSYVSGGDGLHMAHNFPFLMLPWSARAYRESIEDFARFSTHATWPAWFLANHDLPRVASRFDVAEDGTSGHGFARARAVALMLYALRGTPFVYQGEELGLPDAVIPPDRVVDVDDRDPERAPMPWLPPSSAGPGAGFSTGSPWLPLVADAEQLNIATQSTDPASTLNLYRRLAGLRKTNPVLQDGTHTMVDLGPDVLAWIRRRGDVSMLAVVNFASVGTPIPTSAEVMAHPELVVSTDAGRRDIDVAELVLAAGEALLLGRR